MREPATRALRRLRTAGPNDPVFDGLLLLGPVMILGIAIGGRTTASVLLAGAYLASLCGYILYNGLTEPN